jgi:TldD protein
MPNINKATEELAGILGQHKADYIEARLEERETSQITYRGRELESIGRSSSSGGNVRAFVRGGWGFASFNSLTDLADRVALAVKQAELASTGQNELAPVSPVRDRSVMMAANPLDIPLADKKRLLDEYNELIWQTPKIQTSVIGYGDSLKKTILVNSLGSFIEQTRADITLRLSAIAIEGSNIQQAGFSVGSRGDFGAIKNLHREVAESTRNAVAMLTAPQVKGGEYTVVLDPILAGVFVHEAFGHLSESDFVYENEKLREVMVLGREFGSKELSIVDDPTVPGLRGSYQYDDEGVPARKNYLIREGKLVGRLHSRETAAKMGEPLTSNARAISYRYAPIVRMSNTYIEPRQASFDDLIADIKEGIYAKNWYGGTTMMEMFTFSAGEAYMIRNGKVAEAIRPVTLTGNVFETLKNIDAIASDLDMNQGGGCGKGGQSPLPVSNGSPHIRIRHCLVGGK